MELMDRYRGTLLGLATLDDADTTGAVYGQIAGAYYGIETIPPPWLEKLAQHPLIESFADKLLERGGGIS